MRGRYQESDVVMIHTKGCVSLTCSKLAEFLYRVDRLFPTPLSVKVNIDEYARKLHDSATVCFAEDNGTIVGIVGGYTENVINNTAFISIVGVLPEFNGKGIATKLLAEFIVRAKLKRLNAVHLYADRNNSVAVHIYQNPRFSGGVEFSCLVGYDCVSNHVRAFENKPIDEFKMLHETFIARKYEEYVTRII